MVCLEDGCSELWWLRGRPGAKALLGADWIQGPEGPCSLPRTDNGKGNGSRMTTKNRQRQIRGSFAFGSKMTTKNRQRQKQIPTE